MLVNMAKKISILLSSSSSIKTVRGIGERVTKARRSCFYRRKPPFPTRNTRASDQGAMPKMRRQSRPRRIFTKNAAAGNNVLNHQQRWK
jgi:hypothetical protein